MDERKDFRDEDDLSIASDDIFIEVPTPKSEEATLSWRNDPSYKYVFAVQIGFFLKLCILFSCVNNSLPSKSHLITSHRKIKLSSK